MVAPSAGGVFFAAMASLILGTTSVSPAVAQTGDVIGVCAKDDKIKNLADSPNDCKKNEYFLSWNVEGEQGPAGNAGATGATGSQGPAGAIGPQGSKGDTGDPGQSGADGAKGDNGDPGQDGADGEQGQQGIQGVAGQAGLACWDLNANGSPDSFEDVTGDGSIDVFDCAGLQGVAGVNGLNGADGAQGPQGPPGESSSGGVQTVFTYTNSGLTELGAGSNRALTPDCGSGEYDDSSDILTGGGCQILGNEDGWTIIDSRPFISTPNKRWICEADCAGGGCEQSVLYAYAVCLGTDPNSINNPDFFLQ